MSATTFAASAQFAATSVLDSGGTVAAAIAAAVLVNARYVPIGVSVAPSMDGSAWLRLVRAQLIIDETWAVSAQGRLLLAKSAESFLSTIIQTAVEDQVRVEVP
jgi:predicted branched-subunit amino acid permease